MEDNSIFISFLVPTRNRYSALRNSINSIKANCSRTINFEILLAIDRDDEYMISKIREIYTNHKTNYLKKKILIMEQKLF